MLTLIYDKNERKFQPHSYSQNYNIQLKALLQSNVQVINNDCSAKDIKGDVILFYDLHSTHNIKIDGIEKLDIPKLEYMDDPHQEEQVGQWATGEKFHKLGRKQRIDRARKRGVKTIICPCKENYLEFLHPFAKDMNFKWIPLGFDLKFFEGNEKPLIERNGISISGARICGNFPFYDFRKWVYENFNINTCNVYGVKYWKWLTQWTASFALDDRSAVAKYFEIAAAGCIPLIQWNRDSFDLGFRNFENCLVVDKTNIKQIMVSILKRPDEFQWLADNAKKLIENNYTIKHFMERIYKVIDEN